MSPPGLEPARNKARRAEGLVEPPMGRSVAATLFGGDRHLFPMARIAPDRRRDLAGGDVQAAPNERKILALKRPRPAVIGELEYYARVSANFRLQ